MEFIMDEKNHLDTYIQQLTETIQPIDLRGRLAWWHQATTGEESYRIEAQKAQIELRKIFASAEGYRYLSQQHHSNDPLITRQHKLLLNDYKENQIPITMIEEIVTRETEIEAKYTNFRGIFKGKPTNNNDLKEVLADSLDSSELEEAWEATKGIGEQVEQLALELIKMRNEAAKKVGYTNYYSMRLDLQELDEERLFTILDELDRLTTPLWKEYKSQLDQSLATRYGIKPDELKPWHYRDPFFQQAPPSTFDIDKVFAGKDIVEISRKFYASLGMPVDDILARSDLYERENKNQHAFCTCIDKKQDVRILCNIRDDEYWMGTQLHELGHAVYDKYIDQNLPYLIRHPSHTLTTEAVAMLFGRLSKDGEFLEQYCGVESETARKMDAECKKQNAQNLLVFARWVLVMTHFERAMYQNPELDLRAYWWDCVERFQWIKRPENRNKPDWAAKLHLACAPVYYQNYILGEMYASQLKHDITKKLEAKKERFVDSPLVGEYLKNRLFKLGARYPWEETILKSTGEKLNPAYFADDIAITN